MKRLILIIVLCAFGSGMIFAQDSIPAEKERKPISKTPFESGICMDAITVATPPSANTLEFVLQHRFGTIQNDFSDLFGIWGASNIRMGLNYSVHKDVVVGFGTTKNKRYQDLSVKYTFLRQRDGGFPLTIGYYFDFAINATNESNFGKNYKFSDRLSYYNELMVARRLGRRFSLQGSFSFTHYNKVDTLLKNDVIGFALLGRVKVSPQTSIVVNYSVPLVLGYDEPFILKYGQKSFYYSSQTPMQNFTIGVEISTSTHAFHIFLGAAQGIIPQDVMMYNNNDFLKGQIIFGFNMTRLWSF
jgi:hypothetical protein